MGAKATIQSQVTTDNARITGTQKHCMAQASILVESVAYTPTEVIAIYQNDIDGIAAVASAKLALADARAKALPAAQTRKTFDRGFKRSIEGAYGNSPATLGDFGIVLATPKVPTVAVKAAALAQAKSTRALRHTMGTKQRAEIKAPATSAASGAAPSESSSATPASGAGATTAKS